MCKAGVQPPSLLDVAQNRRTSSRSNNSVPGEEKLGTFLGVFTPSILTILGVILFLRSGWVVGNVGLLGAVGVSDRFLDAAARV